MQKKIVLGACEVVYQLKRSRNARHLCFSVFPDRDLLVTAPKRVPVILIEDAMHRNEQSILSLLQKRSTPKEDPRKRYLEYREKARVFIKERLRYWNEYYKFAWGAVSVRNQSSRWGSCSQKGNLNFSYKLALLPEHLADYIIVHELCHLREMNHSSSFWNLVAQTMPDYREKRKELKSLHF